MKRSKRRFQTLGLQMLQFSRRIISDYIPSGDLAEADELDMEWSPSGDMPNAFQGTFEPEPVGDGPTYVPPRAYSPPPTQETLPPAAPRPVEPTTRRQPPQPVQSQPTSAPKPAVQRKPASSSDSKLEPRLLRILEAHQQLDADREAIREQKKAMLSAPSADAQRSPDESSQAPPRRRGRGSASFDYVETSSLKRGMEDDMPPARTPTPIEANIVDAGEIETPTSDGGSVADAIHRAEAIEPSDMTEVAPVESEYTDSSENIVQRSPEPMQYDDAVEADLETEFPEDDLDAFQRDESLAADSSSEVVQRASDSEYEAESASYDEEVVPETGFDAAPETIQRTPEPADFEESTDEEPIQRDEQPGIPSPTTQESNIDYNEPQEWATEVYSPELIQRAIDYSANTIEYPEDREWVTEYDPYGDYAQPEDDATYAEDTSYDNDFGAQDVADSPAPRAEHIQREIYDDYPTDIVDEPSAPGTTAPVDFGDIPPLQRSPEDDMPEYAGDPEFFTNFGAPQEAEAQVDEYEPESSQPSLEYVDESDDPFFDQPTEKVSPSWATPAEQVQRDYQAPENVENDYAQPSDYMSQQTDLYSAMVDAGMIPPAPADTHDVSPPSQHIQRYPETSMSDTDSASTPADSTEIRSTPDNPRSLEEDLLGLLDLHPPVADTNRPEIQRDMAVSYGQPPADSSTFGSGINYTSSDQIQRAITIDDTSSPSPNEEGSSGEGGDVDVEKLARDVFSALRNRLRIERERRHKN